MNGQLTFTLTQPTFATCEDATFNVYIDNEPFDLTAINDAELIAGGPYGFDDVIQVMGLGEGMHYIALEVVDADGCFFTESKCLAVGREIIDLQVNDTKTPKLSVTIDDPVIGQTTVVGNGPADEANENTKTIDLGTIDTGADCCFTVDFLIEAEDNCDGFPVVTATSTGNVTRSEVIEDVGNPQAGMFEGAIKVIFCPGQSSVTLTSTDENGNTSSITYLVKIEDKPVVIDLQASTFYVGVCESDIGFNYSFLIIDPCNTITTVSPFTTGGSLAPFEDMSQRVIEKIGNSLFVQVVFMDVPEDDYNFNVTFDNTLASVPISVVPLSESNFKDLSCNDDVNVSLGDDCASVVTADMVLEGTNLCNDNFVIDITYDAQNWESNRISRKGTYVYEAFTIDNKFICQGRITGVDNDDPTYPREIFDAVVTCDDIDTLLALSDDELLRTRIDDICFFDGKSWDILEAQNAFFIDDITDNCSDYCELIFDISDNFVSGDLCAGERMIERTINVTDAHGNTSTFIVRFIAEQPELLFDEIEDQTLDLCLGDYDLTETGQPYYYSYCLDDEGERIKVYPTFDETNTSRFCGFILSFEDTEFPEECGGIKLIRNWTYIDECENPNELQEIEEQIIKLDYLTPPDVSCDPDFPDVISTSGIDCLADYIFPAPIVDGCIGGSWDYNIKLYQIIPELNERGRPTGDSIEVLATYPITRLDGGSYTVTGLEVGKYRISYQVVTECGVVTEPIYCPFDVKDLVEPVVVLNDELNVAIGGENIAKVCLQDVDEGSKDNCELVDLKIRRELWDEACRQSYIEQVLGVSSLDDLIKEDLGDGQAVWYRVEGGINRVDLVVLELTKDGLQYFSAWQECVLFTCCDVTSAVGNYTVVEARAEDKHGNVNTNWMKVTIENKIIPRCIAPDPITLECIDLTEMEAQDINFVRSRFGTAQELIANNELIIDFNCTVEVEDTISWMAGDCSEGMLTRIFTVYAPDGSGINTSTCEQKINIERVIDYQIKFPADYQETCQGDGGEDLEIETYGCDIFAIYRDTVDFEVFEDFCFRRYVTYSVVNWCEYDGVTEEPTIIVRDIDCDDDTFECTWFRNDRGNVYIDDDDNPKDDPIVFWRRGDDSYDSGECDLGGQPYEITPGFWEYTQSIEVFDNTAPEIDVDTFDFCAFGASGAAACRGEVWVPYTVKDICTKEVETRSVLISIDGAQAFDARNDLYTIVDEGDGRFAVMSMPDVGIPEGNHTFVITVADKCGNVQTRETPFTVTDCKTPSPLCYAELTVDLFPLVENEEIVGGMNSFPAVDFIAISSQDCNPHPNADPLEDGENEVRYYAVRQDEIVAAGLDLPTADYLTDEYRAVDFTCFDEGRVIVVFVIGEDGLGNFDFCTINVTVDQGQDPCDGLDLEAARIAGSITSEKGDPVADVEVTLSGSMSQKLTTNNSGNYFFDGIILGNDYTVTPNLDQDYSNGVSTFDLVLITKHILGVSDFDTPYKLIAADVNNSGSITTLDLIQLRKMILSISDEFSNNTSWRFIPVDHQFANPAQPWNTIFPEFINLNNLDDDVLTADFMAVKVGDVNGSVSPNGLVSSIRNFKGTFPISAEDAIMQQNETYEVSLSAKAIKQVEGFQFTLSFDVEKIELVDIQHSLLKDENIGLRYVEDGFITVSWNGTNSQFDEELFTLSFKAKSSVQLSKVLNVSSRFTAAEAYANNGNLNNIAFEFDGQALIQDKVELYQNIPNPFNNTTTIGFYLPEATGVNILFRDANGRILHQLNGNYSKGKNQIQINKKDLGSGVIYYTLESGAFVITKRMLVL
ncbi:MAG: cohesin domain-containing protein [Bacteroidota bacterium]